MGRGVKLHEGALFPSADVRASSDHIIFPPAGVVSSRQAAYRGVESLEAPNADTVVFRLKAPEASFMANASSPWDYIYPAQILARDPRWNEPNINGTGPSKFAQNVRGSHCVGKQKPDYTDKCK